MSLTTPERLAERADDGLIESMRRRIEKLRKTVDRQAVRIEGTERILRDQAQTIHSQSRQIKRPEVL